MHRREAWGTPWAPLSLALIATVLRDSGFCVRLKDCPAEKMDFGALKDEIVDFRPEIIVVNTSTPSIRGDLKLAEFSKKICPDIKTIFFGIHVTALPEEVLREAPDVQFIAAGEPEFTIRDFALAVRDKKNLNLVEGLVYRSRDRIIYNQKRPFIKDLDELPFLAWDLVNTDNYRLPITGRKFLLVLTERGCRHLCGFCAAGSYYGVKARLRSYRKVVEEMTHVKNMYGVNDFLFWSEDSLSDRQQIYDISNALAEELPGVKWVCNGRVDMIDETLLKAMQRGGCWMIGYGIEAGTQKALDLMKKGIKIDDIEKAVSLTKKAGIEITGHIMVGYPGEREEDILETAKLLKRLELDYIQAYCCVPFPGSFLYKTALESGWIDSKDWTRFEQNICVINTPYLSSARVMFLRKKIIKDFYLNPRVVLRILRKIKSLREMLNFIGMATRYIMAWALKKDDSND